jgi:parallel beta-helix repeat protein
VRETLIEDNEIYCTVYRTGGHGIYMTNSDNSNIIQSNSIHNLFVGLYLHLSSSPKVMNNTIYDIYCDGIDVYHGDSAPYIFNNTIYNIKYWGIMNEDSNATIISNEIYNVTEGICLTTQPGTTKGSNCWIEGNTIYDIYRYYPHPSPGRSSRVSGIQLGGRSTAVILNNTIYNCTSPYTYKGYGIYVYTLNTPTLISDNNCSYNDYGIVIISSDPNLEMTNNTMIGNAHEGMSIQNLARSVYVGYNYFINNGEGISSWNSDSQVNNNMILSSTNYGFRIGSTSMVTAKYNVIEGSTYGISLEGSASCKIINNYINESSSYGIWVTSSSSNTIYDNTIYNNTYGIYLFQTSGNTIDENYISENDYGIYMNNSSPMIKYNDIVNNTIVGIKSCYFAEPDICNNTIDYNRVGVWNEYFSNGTINNNTVSYNSEAIILFSSSPPITYNNITNNDAGIQCLHFILDGIYDLGPSDPLINWNNFYYNTYYCLYNGDLFTTINAEHNFWGLFTGPGPNEIQGGPVDSDPYETDLIEDAGPQ